MKSPVFALPGSREALLTIVKATESCGVPRATLELVNVRVGQINGCSVCVDMHSRMLNKLGESDTRIFALAAWRETPYYTEAERAALALAEAATRLSDRADAVPDEVWKAAARHFSEAALGALVMTIALANLWNRLNVATQQVTGDWIAQYVAELVGARH
ncbi:MAG TPA: carboxymuconolactone decarboxylase family protein [Haliangiales bacterium]|nr:carboxymuconolactone decarboxylase family protein [Haliangiales bacterium]